MQNIYSSSGGVDDLCRVFCQQGNKNNGRRDLPDNPALPG